MKLRTWREQVVDLTLAEVAALVSAKVGRRIELKVIHRLERGQVPKSDVAHALIEISEGKVTLADLCGIEAAGEAA